MLPKQRNSVFNLDLRGVGADRTYPVDNVNTGFGTAVEIDNAPRDVTRKQICSIHRNPISMRMPQGRYLTDSALSRTISLASCPLASEVNLPDETVHQDKKIC